MGAPAAVGLGSKVPVYTLETNQLSIWPARPPSGDTLLTYCCSEPAKTFATLLPPLTLHPVLNIKAPRPLMDNYIATTLPLCVIAYFDTRAALILTNCLDMPRASDNKSVWECCTLQIRRVSKISMDRGGLHGTNCLDAGSLGEARRVAPDHRETQGWANWAGLVGPDGARADGWSDLVSHKIGGKHVQLTLNKSV